MTIDKEGRLLISFEGKAKIGWFHKDSDKMGERIRKYTLPKVLRDTKNYRSNPFVVTLKKVYLKGCSRNGMCRTEVLAKMNSHRGWQVDNFEGLARVGKHRYVMVSDDNDNFYQRTLLIYFEVLP